MLQSKQASFPFQLFMNFCYCDLETSLHPSDYYCMTCLWINWWLVELIMSVSFHFWICFDSSYVGSHTKQTLTQENTDCPQHAWSSATPRDVIWQLSALIGPEHVGGEAQAPYQGCKGALSGSETCVRSRCPFSFAVSDFASFCGLPQTSICCFNFNQNAVSPGCFFSFSFSFSCHHCQLRYTKMSQVKRRKLITEEDEGPLVRKETEEDFSFLFSPVSLEVKQRVQRCWK